MPDSMDDDIWPAGGTNFLDLTEEETIKLVKDMLDTLAIKAAFTPMAAERRARLNARIAVCKAYLAKLSQKT
jgi:hypothetical protein